MLNQKSKLNIYTSLLYLIGILLLLEWLYPTSQIGDTSSLHLFITFALFCMVITMLSLRWWLSTILKGLGIVIIINMLFFSESIFSIDSIFLILDDFKLNINFLLAKEWHMFSPLFRSFLFLLMIWLMSYLIHYWFVVTRKFLLFIILTIAYLAIIDTFTHYDATMAIIRAFILSFFALGLVNFYKHLMKESFNLSLRMKTIAWVVPLIFVVLFSAVIGYASPKYKAQWPDPMTFMQGMTDPTGIFIGNKNATKKVGLGEDDSQLGGSFVNDHSVVFEAIVPDEQYWRVDTKDFYTGKGWEDSRERTSRYAEHGIIRMDLYSNNVDRAANFAVIKYSDNTHFGKLPYPYEIYGIAAEKDVNIDFEYDSSGAIKAFENESYDLDKYSLIYSEPTFSIEQLLGADISEIELDNEYHFDLNQFTQVPDTLPDRVAELAKEITEPYEFDYDKVTAIENYFNQNGYSYETKNVPYPDENEDYVDQFLFETKYGYCDNFSTSMVVMLRTLDIPARWVKGYTSGELIEENVNYYDETRSFDLPHSSRTYNKYEVTNSNAHSWVEVFFPEIGWVPFEPTKGFSNYADFAFTEVVEGEEPEAVNPDEEQLDVEDQEPIVPENDVENDQNTAADKEDDASSSQLNYLFYIIPIFIVIGAVVVFRTRITTFYYRKKLQSGRNVKMYERAYLYLLDLLSRKGYEREDNQTLREYAQQIDHVYRTDEMAQLTDLYELILYKNDEEFKGDEISELWNSIVKRVMA